MKKRLDLKNIGSDNTKLWKIANFKCQWGASGRSEENDDIALKYNFCHCDWTIFLKGLTEWECDRITVRGAIYIFF